MRLLIRALLGVLILAAEPVIVPGAPPTLAAAFDAQGQPDGQPTQPRAPESATTSETQGTEMTSAGWANVLWIAVALVLAVVFVGLAMVGMRSKTRQ